MVVCVYKQARPKDGSCPLTIRENIAYIMGQRPWSIGEECGDNTFNTAYRLSWRVWTIPTPDMSNWLDILHYKILKDSFLSHWADNHSNWCLSIGLQNIGISSLKLSCKTKMSLTMNSDHDMSLLTRNLHQDNGDHGSNAVRHDAVTVSWSLHLVWRQNICLKQ